jgi:hypothetical protein
MQLACYPRALEDTLLQHRFLSPLTIFNIEGDPVPLDDLSVFVIPGDHATGSAARSVPSCAFQVADPRSRRHPALAKTVWIF